MEKPSYWNDLTLLEKFILSRWEYGRGTPIIEDAEYTYLLLAMRNTYPNNEYTNRTWSNDPCPVLLLNKVGLSSHVRHVVLGDTTDSIPSLNTYLEIQDKLANFNGKGYLSFKLDGWNIQFNYYNGQLVTVQSRGRDTKFKEYPELSKYVPESIPAMGKVRVVTEITISRENFAICSERFDNANSRSAVSTILARPEEYNLLSINAHSIQGVQTDNVYHTLLDWGFHVVPHVPVSNYEEVLAGIALLSQEHADFELPTDGIVFTGAGIYAIRVGPWKEPIYRSFVTGYRESYNMHRISPQIRIYPILRNGSMQRNINATNWQRIMDYRLEPGSPIAFNVVSSAIADIDLQATKILQEAYAGRYAEYAEEIIEDQRLECSIEQINDIEEICDDTETEDMDFS